MDVASVALVVAALGVSFGWQPSQEDPQAYEVLMQVEPELVDVLHSGRRIPIESHVPASVTPIRNIRVVVGTDELPRTSIVAKSETSTAKAPAERIVRGQEVAPIEHTTRFQSDDGWSGDRYSPTTTGGNRQFDQRGATIGVDPIRTAQASPWTLDGAQQAATDAGNSLRNSVNSGIEQTNQQFSQGGQQMLDSAQNAGRDFGQQLQNMSGFGGQTATPTASSGSRSSQSGWPAPPPFANAPANRTTTPATWSSIQPQLAPPRLMTPPMANNVRVAANPSAGRMSSGPAFPPPPTSIAPPLHSVLSDPAATSSRTADQDWSSWGTGSASNSASRDAASRNTASSDNDAGVGLEPVPPRPRTTSTPATVTANSNPVASPVDDRYKQFTTPAPATNSAADAWANFGQPQNNQLQNAPQQVPAAVAAAPQNQPVAQQGPINQPAIGTQPLATQHAPNATNTEEVRWKPLLAVCLALAGSLGANVFLGMSYAEARHRYRALVAKTTHSFQKAAGVAA